MRELLVVRGCLEVKIQTLPEGGYGRVDLHIDDTYGYPEPGFLAMCSTQRPGQDNASHDHGASWVVYGVYHGAIEQTTIQRKEKAAAPSTRLSIRRTGDE